jgi:hypothetical protein
MDLFDQNRFDRSSFIDEASAPPWRQPREIPVLARPERSQRSRGGTLTEMWRCVVDVIRWFSKKPLL